MRCCEPCGAGSCEQDPALPSHLPAAKSIPKTSAGTSVLGCQHPLDQAHQPLAPHLLLPSSPGEKARCSSRALCMSLVLGSSSLWVRMNTQHVKFGSFLQPPPSHPPFLGLFLAAIVRFPCGAARRGSPAANAPRPCAPPGGGGGCRRLQDSPSRGPPDSKPRAARGADGDGDTDRALTGRGGAVLPVPKPFQARGMEQELCWVRIGHGAPRASRPSAPLAPA